MTCKERKERYLDPRCFQNRHPHPTSEQSVSEMNFQPDLVTVKMNNTPKSNSSGDTSLAKLYFSCPLLAKSHLPKI